MRTYLILLCLMLNACAQPSFTQDETVNCSTASDAVLEGYKGKPESVSIKQYDYKDSLGVWVPDTSFIKSTFIRFDTSGQVTYWKVFYDENPIYENKYEHSNGITTRISYISYPPDPIIVETYWERAWKDSFSYTHILKNHIHQPNIDSVITSQKSYSLDKQCRIIKVSDTAIGATTTIREYAKDGNNFRLYWFRQPGNIIEDLQVDIIARDENGNALREETKDKSGKLVQLRTYSYTYY